MLLRYWTLASTSIGAIVDGLQPRKPAAVKPASVPNAKYGNRAVPPATGYAAPSSACTSASTASIAPASTQEISDAGRRRERRRARRAASRTR